MVEAFGFAYFTVKKVLPRFLRYSMKNSFLTNRLLIQFYLRLRVAYPLPGKGMFNLTRKGLLRREERP